MNITVVNIKVVSKRGGLSPELGWTDWYVGRPSVLGNPFTVKTETERSVRIAQYRKWLWEQIQLDTDVLYELIAIARQLVQGQKVRLICWCAPNPCHADVIMSAVKWIIESRKYDRHLY